MCDLTFDGGTAKNRPALVWHLWNRFGMLNVNLVLHTVGLPF